MPAFSLDGIGLSPVLTQNVTATTDQTITFGTLPKQTYGVAPIRLTATASSGLAVRYVVSGPASASAAGVLTITGAGTVTVKAYQDGNAAYNPAPAVSQSFTVDPASPTVSIIDAGGTYDHTAFAVSAATVTGVASDGTIAVLGDSSLSYTYYQGTTALSGAPVKAGSYGVVAHYAGSANYKAADSPLVNFTITPRVLTVSATSQNKTYDGATGATVSLADNRIVGDVFTDADTAAAFADKNVGTGKVVSVSGISISGADASNYSFNVTASAAADITKRALAVSAAGQNKVYDGTTAATVTLSDNRVSGDGVVETYTSASFSSKNVGAGKVVSVSGISISGADAGNYSLAATTAATTAGITARSLTVSATGVNKVYDGTTAATVTLSDNRVSGDVVVDAYGSATFADMNVGTGKTVSVTGITISGTDAGNYSANTTTTTANITSASSTTTLVSSATNNTSFFGASVTFTVTVSAAIRGGGTPTGVVTFLDGSSTLGTGTLNGSGVTTLSNSLLTVGVHSIKAVYAANSNFLTSTSSTLSQTVLTSVYVLNTTGSAALSLSGNAGLNIAGLVEVDSSSPSALSLSGNASLSAARIQVVGGMQKSGNATINHPPVTGAGVYLADPLAGLVAPTGGTPQSAVTLSGNSSLTINPGVFSQISVSGNARLTLNPGVYVITGGGFTVTGNGSATGTGVMIYNAGSNYSGGTGGNFGGVTLSGNGSIDLSAPTSGPYAGIVFFQSRDNSRVVSLSGNSMVLHGGVIYAPAALLSVSGNASLSGSVIVNQLQLAGNASSTLTSGGSDAENASHTAGALVSGILTLFVDNTQGSFTADQLARVDEAIASINAVVSPFGAYIKEVFEAESGAKVLTMADTSACGTAADGVLGAEDSGGITIVSGWNWYDGANGSAVGTDQYDFETIVMHELGHSLGLGHRDDASSVMYATLSAGEAKRALVVADLNVEDTGSGADALHASPTAHMAAVAAVASPRPHGAAAVPSLTSSGVALGAGSENPALAAMLHPPTTSIGTGSALASIDPTPLPWNQSLVLVTMSIPDAPLRQALDGSSPSAIADGYRSNDLPLFGAHSLDAGDGTGSDAPIGGIGYDRLIDGNADLWGGALSSKKERDQALESIMAEWSSDDGFTTRLPDSLATPKAEETLDGVTDHSASDWFFSRGGDMWGILLHEENVETNSEV